jgi:hypothetical protein
MALRVRDVLPVGWFQAALVGAGIAFAASVLSLPWALAVGTLLAGAAWAFAARASRKASVAYVRRRLLDPSDPFPVPTPPAGWEDSDDPLRAALEGAGRAPATEAPAAGDPSSAPPGVLSLSLEELLQEQEGLAQSFHAFKESVLEWSSSIEKAGRINKSLLQLNELIVSDSKKVAEDTDEAARSATQGIKSVGKEIKAMTEIKATIGSSAEVIQQLSLASEQIGDFLATITTIARKTNLLALNAGIEAARAGEYGQGFAVVAGEIKTLAEAAAKASGDVKHLVDDIRSKTSSAIFLISSTGKIEENVNVVYSAGDVFMNIVKSIRKAGGLLGEISQALDDQRNDNELLLQLLSKVNRTGDTVRTRFETVEQRLDQVQGLSRKMKASLEGRGSGAVPGP